MEWGEMAADEVRYHYQLGSIGSYAVDCLWAKYLYVRDHLGSMSLSSDFAGTARLDLRDEAGSPGEVSPNESI
jgi:hypothetical protein